MFTASLVIVAIIALFVLGQVSSSGAAPGLVDNRLARCPDTPNCVCSEYPDDSAHFIKPIALSGTDPSDALENARAVISALGGKIQSDAENYLAATFTSSLFRFVDDLEIRLDAIQRVLHVRSASRVGRSDLGANRRRVETIRSRFEQHDG